jgi:hypothetical protein
LLARRKDEDDKETADNRRPTTPLTDHYHLMLTVSHQSVFKKAISNMRQTQHISTKKQKLCENEALLFISEQPAMNPSMSDQL